MNNSKLLGVFKYFMFFASFTTIVLIFKYNYDITISTRTRQLNSLRTQEKARPDPWSMFASDEEALLMTCKIPKLDPFDKEIMRIVNPNGLEPRSCMDKTKMKFRTDYHSNLIQVGTYQDFFETVECCYFSYQRGKGNDMSVVFSELKPDSSEPICHPITSNVTKIPVRHVFISVKCWNKDDTSRKTLAYQDFFGIIQRKTEIEQRAETLTKKWQALTPGNDPLNVIIFGLDSVSHMNFQRFMPKTRNYLLDKLNAIEFYGRNKVGESTFENVTPTLTGFFTAELQSSSKCFGNDLYFDKCPFMWKNFSEHGYRTLYGEDSIHRSVYLDSTLNGFRDPIVDYDFRTLIRGIETWEYTDGCYKHQHAANILTESMVKMLVAFKDKLSFQFQWLSTGNHDSAPSAKFNDDPIHESLKYLHEENLLNNSVFILISDHGMTFGKYVSTEQGMLESRMPLLIMAFPKWFTHKYSKAIENMRKNAHRLTTPFDFHATIMQLLNTEDISNEKLTELGSIPKTRGISLFLPVPLSRTCEDAGITDHWCICWSKKEINNPSEESRLIKGADFAIESINKKLEILGNLCLKLSLNKILSGRILKPRSSKFTSSTDEKYDVIFQSNPPSNGIFQVTIKFNKHGEIMGLGGGISRINAFGNDGNCILSHKDGSRELQELCYCIVNSNQNQAKNLKN